MGKRAVKEYFNVVCLVASILLFIFAIIGLYGGNVNPVGHTLRAMSTMMLPFILVCNFIVLLYWAIRRSWFVFIPIVAILCCINYIGTMFQFGDKPENVNANFTIASYNVRSFNNDGTGVVAMDVINSLEKEGADIICMQEFNNSMSGEQTTVCDKVKDVYPYQALAPDMVILSRLPIKKTHAIPFEMSNNGGMWADVQLTKQKIVRIYNVHMETTGINGTLHKAAKRGDITEADSTSALPMNINNSQVANDLMGNYIFNSLVRSGQAITISNDKRNSPYPILLCGDFNDVPYSFVYNTLLGDLKDGFREGGHGYGATYRGAKGIFRIDYIFHQEGMQCVDYYTVDQDFSDHNPVISKILLK